MQPRLLPDAVLVLGSRPRSADTDTAVEFGDGDVVASETSQVRLELLHLFFVAWRSFVRKARRCLCKQLLLCSTGNKFFYGCLAVLAREHDDTNMLQMNASYLDVWFISQQRSSSETSPPNSDVGCRALYIKGGDLSARSNAGTGRLRIERTCSKYCYEAQCMTGLST